MNSFAKKWIRIFEDPTVTHIDIVDDLSFSEDCFALGFQMDCGEAITRAFSDRPVFEDPNALEEVIGTINDVMLLGSAVFSKWRYYNHWAGPGELITEESSRKWFITALRRLLELTEEDKGELLRVRIVSNCLGYGPCPEPEDEVEQHLTVTRDGRVFFSRYCFGTEGRYERTQSVRYKILDADGKRLLDSVGTCFTGGYLLPYVTDVGSWDIELFFENGQTESYSGSLYSAEELVPITKLFREVLKLQDLFLFTGVDIEEEN